jgi:aspartate kinase
MLGFLAYSRLCGKGGFLSLIVQKFGGTSVGTIERIRHVAKWALDSQARGNDVVLVVSAMSGETNRLVELATQINPVPYSREYDMLIASGEQVAVGLVSLAINTEAQARGLLEAGQYRSRPLLGHQIGIRTDSVFSKARIQAIDDRLLQQEISRGVIPVIAGFQGVDPENNITTLGRGGSDTSAVAIAVALKASVCEIYTDVDGVYTTDPRLCSGARKMKRIAYEEMMELASLGAKVLQIRSVELAAKYEMPLHVRSSFNPVEGTMVVSQELLGKEMEQVVVAGVAADAGQAKFTLQNLPEGPGVAAKIFGALSDAAIVVDVIVQDVPSNGRLTVSFTVGKGDYLNSKQALERLQKDAFREMKIVEEQGLAKVSIVGVGMQHHPGVASKMFALLAREKIDIKLITTSEIKVSCMIVESDTKRAVESLHQGFGLERVQ